MKNFYYDDAPLIFDEKYEKKPAYYALRDSMKTLSIGGTVGGNVDLLCDESWGDEWIPRQEVVSESNETAGDSKPDWEQ